MSHGISKFRICAAVQNFIKDLVTRKSECILMSQREITTRL